MAEAIKGAASHLKAEKSRRLSLLLIQFVFVATAQMIMNLFSFHMDVTAPSFHR